MPTSGTGRSPEVALSKQGGFTLLEVLVVVVIVAVLAGAVLLNADLGGGAAALDEEAHRLKALIELSCEDAVLRGQSTGVSVSAEAFRFWLRGREGVWLPRAETRFRPRRLPAELRLAAPDAQAGRREDVRPQVVCSPVGERNAFRLVLTGPQGVREIQSDTLGPSRVLAP